MADERAYNVGLHSGLLDPRHFRAMRESLWLYLWYVRRQTDVRGNVAGGDALGWQRIQETLPVSVGTLKRWQRILAGENPEGRAYIEVQPGPGRGFGVRILRARKKFRRKSETGEDR